MKYKHIIKFDMVDYKEPKTFIEFGDGYSLELSGIHYSRPIYFNVQGGDIIGYSNNDTFLKAKNPGLTDGHYTFCMSGYYTPFNPSTICSNTQEGKEARDMISKFAYRDKNNI